MRRWVEVLSDPALAIFEGRVETDRHGRVIWTCTESGAKNFFGTRAARPMRASQVCLQFPKRIELR